MNNQDFGHEKNYCFFCSYYFYSMNYFINDFYNLHIGNIINPIINHTYFINLIIEIFMENL